MSLHGPRLTAIVDGMPAGVPLTEDDIARDLARRQQGYGRGGRMRIEQDRAAITGGVEDGKTTGGPISLQIENLDWPNWKDRILPSLDRAEAGPRRLGRRDQVRTRGLPNRTRAVQRP